MTASVESWTELEELSRERCFELLADHEVGRIAIVRNGDPFVFPVNYVLDNESIVFRSDPGLKLRALHCGRVGFQLDQIDPTRRTGWSVFVQGTAFELTHWERDHLTVQPWAAGDKRHWVRILPKIVSGRSITRHVPELDARGYV